MIMYNCSMTYLIDIRHLSVWKLSEPLEFTIRIWFPYNACLLTFIAWFGSCFCKMYCVTILLNKAENKTINLHWKTKVCTWFSFTTFIYYRWSLWTYISYFTLQISLAADFVIKALKSPIQLSRQELHANLCSQFHKLALNMQGWNLKLITLGNRRQNAMNSEEVPTNWTNPSAASCCNSMDSVMMNYWSMMFVWDVNEDLHFIRGSYWILWEDYVITRICMIDWAKVTPQTELNLVEMCIINFTWS